MTYQATIRSCLLLAMMIPLILTGCGGGKKATQKVSFKKDITPILQKNCFECHLPGRPGQVASGLDMTTYQTLMKGTKFGPVIKPGNSVSSTLVILVEGRADPSIKMPHGGRPSLSTDEIKTIKQWIDQGAKDN